MGLLQSEEAPRGRDDLRIIPFNFVDNMKGWRMGIAATTFRFNAAMNAEKLRRSLQRLFEMEGWRKLGARIKMDKHGNLEHHVPPKFDEKWPAFNWYQELHTERVEEHPVARLIPGSVKYDAPKIFDDISISEAFLYPIKHKLPTKFDDYIRNDIAPLTVYVHVFADCTLITLSWSHVWIDGIGQSLIVNAWAKVMDGRESEVPKFTGFDTDPIGQHLAETKTTGDKSLLYPQLAKTHAKFLQLARMLIEFKRYPWADNEDRVICLPAAYVAELKSRASAEVNGDILSTGDVLFAWRTKLLCKALALKSTTPIGLCQPYSLRGLVDTLPVNEAYTANAVGFTYLLLTVKEIETASLGDLAMQLRRNVKKYRTQVQATSYLQLSKQHDILVLGPYDQIMMCWSNWSAGDYFNVDFSKARTGQEGSGKPAALFTYSYMGRIKLRNAGCILGKDENGDVWLNWAMRPNAWSQATKMIMNKEI